MANEMRDRLRGLLLECGVNINTTSIADHLIENGVIVPLCNVGDTVYVVCEDDEGNFISENKVTEVCSKGFFVSSFDPPQDDMGGFELYEEIGKTIFLSKQRAEHKLMELSGDACEESN